MKHTRGFTLVELAFVIGLLGVLTAIAIPSYHLVVLRTRAAEARALLPAIAHAELTYRRDHGRYLECLASDEKVPKTGVPFAARPCWGALGVRTDGEVRFRYEVRLVEGGFEAIAEGDLDADGVTSRYVLTSKDLSVSVKDELE